MENSTNSMGNISSILNGYINSEAFLTLSGSDIYKDSIGLLGPLFAFVGIFANLASFLIIQKIPDHQIVYTFKLLKIYSINSALFCMTSFPDFYIATSRFIGFKLDLFSSIYNCTISPYNLTSLYFVGSALNIILDIDRLAFFVKKFEPIRKLSPWLVYLVLMVVCHVINLPQFFDTFPKVI